MDNKKLKVLKVVDQAISRNSQIRDKSLLYIPSFFAGIDIFINGSMRIGAILLISGVLFMILSFFCTESCLKAQEINILHGKSYSKHIDKLNFMNSICNMASFLCCLIGFLFLIIK